MWWKGKCIAKGPYKQKKRKKKMRGANVEFGDRILARKIGDVRYAKGVFLKNRC